MESALTISPPRRSARPTARSDLPAAVGPTTARTSRRTGLSVRVSLRFAPVIVLSDPWCDYSRPSSFRAYVRLGLAFGRGGGEVWRDSPAGRSTANTRRGSSSILPGDTAAYECRRPRRQDLPPETRPGRLSPARRPAVVPVRGRSERRLRGLRLVRGPHPGPVRSTPHCSRARWPRTSRSGDATPLQNVLDVVHPLQGIGRVRLRRLLRFCGLLPRLRSLGLDLPSP